MDSDGTLDKEHCYSSNNIKQDKSSLNPVAGSSSKAVKVVGDYSVSKKGVEEDLKDPLPGPSNSASDFDLEVFDSGSSCSNEECWTVLPDKFDTPIKKLDTELEDLDKEIESITTKTMEEVGSDSEAEVSAGTSIAPDKTDTDVTGSDKSETATDKHSNPQEIKGDVSTSLPPPTKPPTTVKRSSRETQTNTDLLIDEPIASTSKGIESELPKETLSRRVSVEMWKSRNETETIVEDHDVYGTDENEDSLDSHLHNEDSLDSTAISSRRTSICGEVIFVDENISRCCSRASNPETQIEGCDSEEVHQPICSLHTQTCSARTGTCYEVKTSTSSPCNKQKLQQTPLDTNKIVAPHLPPAINKDLMADPARPVSAPGLRRDLMIDPARPVSASGLCRRLQLIEVESEDKDNEGDSEEQPGEEQSHSDEDDHEQRDAGLTESTNTDSDSNLSSMNGSTLMISSVKPAIQTANFQTQTDPYITSHTPLAGTSTACTPTAPDNTLDSSRPKRKSGSFTELSLACLPLKRQKPECLSPRRIGGVAVSPHSSGSHSLTNPFSFNSSNRESQAINFGEGTPDGCTGTLPLVGGCSTSSEVRGDTATLMSLDESLLNQDNSYLSLCDNTAPTSPASPTPSDPGDMEGVETTPGSPHSKVAPSGSRTLMSPGTSGRQLIPDRENPPAEITSWVSTFSRWSNAERLMAIDQLINTCEPQQVRHMMQVIEPQFQRDFISLLPKELALYVLSYLHPKDLLRAAQTCRYWRILAEDNLLWREKCREAGLSDAVSREHFYHRRRKQSTDFVYSTYKLGFMRQHNIEMNWRQRPIRSTKVLKGHDDHVITCLQFSGTRIVSGSDDNTLKVWSAVTGKCLRTLVGHTGGVWSSQLQGNTIVSGSTDRTLKVWNAETGSCVHTLYGHTSTVRCMHLHNNKVVSGSRDATLRMWDIDTGECNIVLIGHVAAVRCVQYDGRLVVSGAYDYMVKVWNPEREECIHTLNGHTNRVYSLQFDGVHVVSGSLDTSIRVWDVETGACKHALMGHQSLTSGMELKDNILVSGNADSTVKIWDILTGQCLQTLSGPNKHQSAVTCLHFNKKFVITSSDDGTVKLWDVKTGDYIRDLVSLESGGSGGVVWRIRSSPTKLVCAVGSRNGTEETKLLVLDFEAEVK